MAGDEHFAPALVLNWMTPALLFCLIYFKGLIYLIIFITLSFCCLEIHAKGGKMDIFTATVLAVAATAGKRMVIFQPSGLKQMGIFFLCESHSVWKGNKDPERGEDIWVKGLEYCPGPDIYLPAAAYPIETRIPDNTEHRPSVINGQAIVITRQPRTGYKT